MDFAVDENGDLAVKDGDFYFVTGVDATIQFLKQSLLLILGEWFLDETKGIAWFDDVFVRNPNPVALDSLFKKTIIESPGVLELLVFTMTIDTETRGLAIGGRIRALDGEADFSITQSFTGGN